MDDPMQIDSRTVIPLAEIVVRASRSSGPGGQHANMTASRIEASFDIGASNTLSDEQKRRLVARFGNRVSAVAQDERSQSRNRELALERLRERLRQALAVAPSRTKTRPTRSSIVRRLEAKRHSAERKRGRRRPSPDQD